LDGTDERLEHRVGVDWNIDNGVTYTAGYGVASKASLKFIKSFSFQTKVLDKIIEDNKQQILDVMSSSVLHTFDEFEFDDEIILDQEEDVDLYRALGKCRVRLSHIDLDVEKNSDGVLSVKKVTVVGVVTDLYDWDYTFLLEDDSRFDWKLAVIQAGFPGFSRNRGQVFKVDIQLNGVVEAYEGTVIE